MTTGTTMAMRSEWDGPRPVPFYSRFGLLSVQKKTLDSAQNLENKRPEIFLPSRSMVLKVVTGKIQKTLKLLVVPTGPYSVFGTAVAPGCEKSSLSPWFSESAFGDPPEAEPM